MALLYTATEARITAYGYEINQLKQSIDRSFNANARYQLEIEELSSPERLSAYAEENLDMVKPDDESHFVCRFARNYSSGSCFCFR